MDTVRGGVVAGHVRRVGVVSVWRLGAQRTLFAVGVDAWDGVVRFLICARADEEKRVAGVERGEGVEVSAFFCNWLVLCGQDWCWFK